MLLDKEFGKKVLLNKKMTSSVRDGIIRMEMSIVLCYHVGAYINAIPCDSFSRITILQ